jgi:hypothetical protein
MYFFIISIRVYKMMHYYKLEVEILNSYARQINLPIDDEC